MEGTAPNKDPARDKSKADRGRDDESMEVRATAPERPPGLPQRRLSSKHLVRNGIKTTSKRWTAVEVRVGRGNYE